MSWWSSCCFLSSSYSGVPFPPSNKLTLSEVYDAKTGKPKADVLKQHFILEGAIGGICRPSNHQRWSSNATAGEDDDWHRSSCHWSVLFTLGKSDLLTYISPPSLWWYSWTVLWPDEAVRSGWTSIFDQVSFPSVITLIEDTSALK